MLCLINKYLVEGWSYGGEQFISVCDVIPITELRVAMLVEEFIHEPAYICLNVFFDLLGKGLVAACQYLDLAYQLLKRE